MKKDYYGFLDGYRAVAISWVVFCHLHGSLNLHSIQFFQSGFLNVAAPVGFLGVDMFFVISGFLITGILIEDFRKPIRIRRFFCRRAFKIIPQYVVVIMASFWVHDKFLGLQPINKVSMLSYFLFFQNYIPAPKGMGHLWSMAVEIHFYLLYAVLVKTIFFFVPEGKRRHFILLIILFAIVVLGNIMHSFYFKAANFNYDVSSMAYTYVSFDGLIFGCILKLLEKKFIAEPISKKMFIDVFCLMGGLLYILFIWEFHRVGSNRFTHYFRYLAPVLLIISSLKGCRLVNRIVSNPFFIWIGKKSYGIYLWHLIVLIFVFKFFTYDNLYLSIPFYILMVIVVGAVSTDTLEKAFLKIRQKVVP